MVNLIFIRHGETDYNLENRYDYQDKAQLTKKGIQQAQEISEFFVDLQIDAFYTSPLKRSIDTIGILAKQKSIDIQIDERIIETIFEDLQDITYDDKRFNNRHKWTQTNKSPGENMQDIAKRTYDFLSEIIYKHQNKTVIICSHVSPIMMLLKHIDNFDWDKDSMKYLLKNDTIDRMFTKRIV